MLKSVSVGRNAIMDTQLNDVLSESEVDSVGSHSDYGGSLNNDYSVHRSSNGTTLSHIQEHKTLKHLNEDYREPCLDNAQEKRKRTDTLEEKFVSTNQKGSAMSYEKYKPKLNDRLPSQSKHVYISPRISARSKHVVRDSREEETMPVSQRTKLEV